MGFLGSNSRKLALNFLAVRSDGPKDLQDILCIFLSE